MIVARPESNPAPKQVSSQFLFPLLYILWARLSRKCSSSLPSFLPPSHSPFTAVWAFITPLPPSSLSMCGMKESVRERAPLCIHLRVFLCTCLCLRKCVFVMWLKFCWLVQASCVRAPIESEQVGPGYYSPANHSFLRVTDWVTLRAEEIQTAHC